MNIYKDYPLLHHNTFGIAVNAARYAEYASADELQELLNTLRHSWPGQPVLHIGGGSNLLFLNDYEGTVVHSCIRGIELMDSGGDEVLLRVGAGVVWDQLVEYCVTHDLYGVENLSLIPGEVGAAAVQNIGAYGAEIKDVLHAVETVRLEDGAPRTFARAECDYGYRHSYFKAEGKGQYAVTHVQLRLSRRFVPSISYGGIRQALLARGADLQQLTARQVRDTIIGIRQDKLPDPAVQGNAGSFFMNPVVPREVLDRLRAQYPDIPYYDVDDAHVKLPAGWLIEQCGWKGRSLGRAAVHARQALVLVNMGQATGTEILALCRQVVDDVRQRFGIALHPEVNIIGERPCE